MASRDKDLNNIEDLDSGIEFDKMELPNVSGEPTKAPVSEKPTKIELQVESELKPKTKFWTILIIVASAILISAAIFTFFETKYNKLDTIITNFGENSYVKVSLLIKNDHARGKESLSIEPIIRDSILALLNSSGTQKIFNESDLEEVESHIYREINNLLKNHYHGKIILKELKVYRLISPN